MANKIKLHIPTKEFKLFLKSISKITESIIIKLKDKKMEVYVKKKQIASHVFWVGSIDWQRRLFDGMLPIPEGTTYNSYLIYGSEKTALLDTVEEPFWPELLSKLADVKKIDYIINLI